MIRTEPNDSMCNSSSTPRAVCMCCDSSLQSLEQGYNFDVLSPKI